MVRRETIVAAAAWAIAAGLIVTAAVAAGLPECLTGGGCDCEAAGPSGIRQPVNAWSSLLLVGAAGWPARRSVRRVAPGLAVAVVAAGGAAFAYHALLTGWAAVLDGAAVTMIAGTFAAGTWRPRIPFRSGLAAAALAAGVSQAIGGSLPGATTAALAGVAAAGLVAGGSLGDARIAASALGLLAVGGVVWVLSGTGGAWCNPRSLLQGHAVWHAASAAALAAAGEYLRSAKPPRPSSLGPREHVEEHP